MKMASNTAPSDIARIAKPSLLVRGDRLLLRLVRLEDAIDLVALVNDPEIAANTLRIPHPYTLEDSMTFMALALEQMRQGVAIVFAMTQRGNDRPLGILGLGGFRHEARRVEIGYWIGRDHWNQGYATEAVNFAVDFCFRRLRLHKVAAEVFAWNAASRRVLEKCGFRHEGILRDHHYKDGQWITCDLFGRCVDE